MRYNNKPNRRAKSIKMAPPNAGEEVEHKKLSFIAGGTVTKWNIFLTCDPAAVLIGIYP